MDLFLGSYKTILEIKNCIQKVENMKEHKHFYSYLIAHCNLIHTHISGTTSSPGQSDQIIRQVLDRLESIVSSKGFVLQYSANYPRLHNFNSHWERLRDHCEWTKLDFIENILDFRIDSDQHSKCIDDLGIDAEMLMKQIPRNSLEWRTDDTVMQRKSIKEPPYAVRNAAQSVFRALMAAKTCTCPTTHSLGATLCLGTYRTPDLGGDFEFDMFLALESHRQETHIQAVKDSAVQFAVNDGRKPPMRAKGWKPPMRIKELCGSIRKVQSMASKCLKLKVEGGQLWKLQSEKSCFQIDGMRGPITLQDFITKRPESLNEKTKRILAVQLSYAVLHFYGTPWLQRTWGSSNILFFRTTSSTIPLKPYMDTELVHSLACTEDLEYEPGNPDGAREDNFDPDDFDPDDDDPDEPLPDGLQPLVTLAVMLMELYHAMLFTTLAKKYGCIIRASGDNQVTWIDANIVFDECKVDMHTQFCHAVEKCLDPQTWKDDYGRKLDTETLRIRIYKEIVNPLENELQQAFSNIFVEDLDKTAQKIDFGCWGRAIQNQQVTLPNYPSSQNAVSGYRPVTGHSQYPQYDSLSYERLHRPTSPSPSYPAAQNVTQTPERDVALGRLDACSANAKISESTSKDRSLEASRIAHYGNATQQQGTNFNSHGNAGQFNAPRGAQNNNAGSGNQFSEARFSGPVYFGNY